jgi:RecB family endonuclease NucS
MPLYHFQSDESLIKPVAEATFKETKLKERTDLQRLLREHIEVLDKNLMVLAEEFGDWEDSDRRIDLLALDKDANLVVIELKRDDSAHMELQAI